MLESIELRWFYEGDLPSHIKTSFNLNLQDNYETRSDYYLLLRNCYNIGIKLRDARLEIKWRKNVSAFDLINLDITGKIEEWIRWEWNDINPYKEIVKFLKINQFDPWIIVDKKRSQNKFNIKDNLLVKIPSNADYSDGAIEITELEINDQKWWSIGIDLFFKDNNINSSIPILRQIIEIYLIDKLQIELNREKSYGYPEWMSKVLNRSYN